MRLVFVCVGVLLVAGAAMMGVKAVNEQIFGPFSPGYDSSAPMRRVVLTWDGDLSTIVTPLRTWAETNGYEFRAWSPAGERNSLSIMIWRKPIIAWGGTVPWAAGIDFSVYWDGDTPDDQALDAFAEQLRAQLAAFGPVEVRRAPPGTQPRTKARAYRRGQ